jgi:hypothetical protein
MIFARGPIAAHMEDDARRAFAKDGAVWVRGALDAGVATTVLLAVEKIFAERAEMHCAGNLPERLRKANHRAYIAFRDLPAHILQLELIPPVALSIGRAYLGPSAAAEGPATVRRVDPRNKEIHLAFHDDQTILNRPLLNVWIPLNACGIDAPGLEVVLGSWLKRLVLVGDPASEYAAERARLSTSDVIGAFETEAFFAPAFEIGDAMIFSGATIHRTHARPEMTACRTSLEMRMIS